MQSAVALSRVGTSWFAKDIDLEEVETLDDLIDQIDPSDVDAAGSGLSVVFVEEDDEWLGIVRVTAETLQDPRIFLSDGRVLVTSPLAEKLFGDALPVLAPVDDEDEETAGRPEATPVGEADLLTDLGTPGDVLVEMCAEEGALPSDVTATLCERAGGLDVLEELRGGVTRATQEQYAPAMRVAVSEARLALETHDVPVGAVVVDAAGRIVSTGRNAREAVGDPTAHAEVLALRAAAAVLGEWRLTGHTLVVTLEPCTMCAGAAVLARVDRIVYGAADPKAGAAGSLWDVVRDRRLNWRPEVVGGVLEEASSALLAEFFREQRGIGPS